MYSASQFLCEQTRSRPQKQRRTDRSATKKKRGKLAPSLSSSSSRFFSTARQDARLGHRLLRGAPLGQAARYREALGLQVEAFRRRNYMILVGAGGVIVCVVLWRIMFGIFVGLSEGMANYGFLALDTAIVAFPVTSEQHPRRPVYRRSVTVSGHPAPEAPPPPPCWQHLHGRSLDASGARGEPAERRGVGERISTEARAGRMAGVSRGRRRQLGLVACSGAAPDIICKMPADSDRDFLL
ncbi:hypothetical protein SEVIR_1G337901v4 [Setaria viridis]